MAARWYAQRGRKRAGSEAEREFRRLLGGEGMEGRLDRDAAGTASREVTAKR